jgi:hypothetical protein
VIQLGAGGAVRPGSRALSPAAACNTDAIPRADIACDHMANPSPKGHGLRIVRFGSEADIQGLREILPLYVLVKILRFTLVGMMDFPLPCKPVY